MTKARLPGLATELWVIARGDEPLTIERFLLNLKRERMWQRQYANHDEAGRDINQYIVGFYNAVRLHPTLGYLSPAAYEAKPTVKEPICLSEIT